MIFTSIPTELKDTNNNWNFRFGTNRVLSLTNPKVNQLRFCGQSDRILNIPDLRRFTLQKYVAK
jgi:hypothetical protein